MAVKYSDDGNDDGWCHGKYASSKQGFHGKTPVVQAGALTLATAATIGTIRTSVQNILTVLRNKGLIAT